MDAMSLMSTFSSYIEVLAPWPKRCLLVLLGTLVLMMTSMNASAQCTVPSDGTGSGVVFETCSEATNNGSLTIDVDLPTGTADGDLLVASVATDGTPTVTPPSGWSTIAVVAAGNSEAQLSVFYKIAVGEAGPYTFSTDSVESEVVTVMRFSGANGNLIFSSSSDTTGTPVAPSVTTTSADNLILRLAAWDDDDLAADPATIIDGYSNINQEVSGTGTNSVTGAAAYEKQSGIASSGTAEFFEAIGADEEWATLSLALAPGDPGTISAAGICPGSSGGAVGSQLVVIEDCSEVKYSSNSNEITINTPATTAEGDLLLLVINSDKTGNYTDSATPSTWTVVDAGDGGRQGPTLGIFSKFASAGDASGGGSYTFGSANAQHYGYMLRITGASGVILSATATGDTSTPTAPDLTSLVDNSLIVRVMAADDDDVTADPATIVSGQRGITQDISDTGNNTVTGAAVYLNQAIAGTNGTVEFTLNNGESWRTATLAIEPPTVGSIDHYAITHGGSGIQCLGSDITIAGHDASHVAVAPGDGEVMTLSTNTGQGTWASIVSGLGALVDVGAQGDAANTDGTGTYTWFGTEDTVVLRFNYTNPSADPESVNFNITGSYSEDTVETNHDDSLTVRSAGLRFFNETDQLSGIPVQISGKPSNVSSGAKTLILQALQTSDDDVSVCEQLFADGATVTVEFAAECDDPGTCSIGQSATVNSTAITLAAQDLASGAAAYSPVDVTFANQTTSTGAPLIINYSDAGQIELHARYDIPFDNDVDFPITSEDYLVGSTSFVVRPFGFDIDFSGDRAGGGALSLASDAAGPAFAQAGTDFSTSVTARQWEAADDLDANGVPDSSANLTNNGATPNFGNESAAGENDVVVTHSLVEPAAAIGSREGTLSGGSFTDFSSGVSTVNLQYSEVGIITLTANLADTDYLGSGADVQGNVVNVGRFYPHNFNLDSATTVAEYTSNTAFTYMGQEFPTSFILQARNADNEITQNYIGDFVKLSESAFDDDGIFHAVDDVESDDDVDYSSRVVSVDGSFTVAWDGFGDPDPGTSAVSGLLVFERENDGIDVDGAEDGPLVVALGTSVQDTDSVAIALSSADINDDADATDTPTTPLYRRLTADDIEFRYGRLLVENVYGPETENLEVPLRIEYWNGSNFVTNTDDDATSLFFDISASPPALDFVATSFQSDPGTLVPLALDQLSIEPDAASDVTVNLFNGRLGRQQDGDTLDSNDPDRPFVVSAPDPLAENGTEGRVLVEFDLDSTTLPESLEFLGYDWRGVVGVDDYDEIPDGSSYTDNPRGILEFGSFRGHDRVINWQEIYSGSSQ